MATSVYSPIYPQFPSNKNAITILRNNGLNMTSIEDVPKTERRRPISERPIRGNRLLHTATFSFERNPNIVGDGTTSYNSEYSGRKGGVLPAVPGRYPSQLRSHFEIGVGSQFHSDTTANSNYVDRLRQSIQSKYRREEDSFQEIHKSSPTMFVFWDQVNILHPPPPPQSIEKFDQN